ncbi:MAG: RelA/SpoT family protein [bacterium]
MKSLNHKTDNFERWQEQFLAVFDTVPDWLREALDQVKQLPDGLKIRDDFICKNYLTEMLSTLSLLDADPEIIAASCLHFSALSTGQEIHAPRETPDSVKHLVRELGRIAHFNEKSQTLLAADNHEGLRRLLLALISDIRVVLYVLAEQLTCLKSLAKGPEDLRNDYARASKLIYSPLANRLGIWNLKWELEDLSLRYLQPADYKMIAGLLDEKRADREQYIHDIVEKIQKILNGMGIEAKVKGRPKHIYSIWKKMQGKKLEFSQLYDVRAVRILVSSVQECYAILGVVHNLWQPIPGEFDDYIASPKGNNYQSLHTAVIAPEGKTVEIQIRTYEMDEHAERGVAAHWRYKEGSKSDEGFDQKINWLRSLLEQKEEDHDEDLLERFSADSSEDRVYALTPKGKVVDMELGSTALDFAYTVHTEVGHKCIGAKVNGRIVPLTYELSTGEKVEILTQKNSEPSRDWMNSGAGYLNSSRNRAKVRQWFRLADRDKNLIAGKEILERNLKQVALEKEDISDIPQLFNLPGTDELYVAIGQGDVTPNQVINRVSARVQPKQIQQDILKTRKAPIQKSSSGIVVGGVGDLMTHIAQCCKPVHGEEILGYVTLGRGISIHRKDCKNIQKEILEQDPRIIDVAWSELPKDGFIVDVIVQAYDRKGLLKDISATLSNQNTEVAGVKSKQLISRGEIQFQFSLHIRSLEHLSVVISALSSVQNVIEARRIITA